MTVQSISAARTENLQSAHLDCADQVGNVDDERNFVVVLALDFVAVREQRRLRASRPRGQQMQCSGATRPTTGTSTNACSPLVSFLQNRSQLAGSLKYENAHPVIANRTSDGVKFTRQVWPMRSSACRTSVTKPKAQN